MSRILVIGIPRSGTTWVSTILSSAPGAVLVNEPDYPSYAAASLAVDEHGLHPVLASDAFAPRYRVVWDIAFRGGFPGRPITRRAGKMLLSLPTRFRQPIVLTAARVLPNVRTAPKHCVVKTVRAQFALDWVVDRYRPLVVVMRRNLLSVVGSWLQLHSVLDTPFELSEDPAIRREFLEPLCLEPPAKDAPICHKIAWQVGLLSTALERATARHPDWIVVDHEVLCESPIERFRDLFSRTGLTWTKAVEREISRRDKPGVGLEVQRVAREQIDSWKSKLGPDQVADATRILRAFRSSPHELSVNSGSIQAPKRKGSRVAS